jgi:hypothetical protein
MHVFFLSNQQAITEKRGPKVSRSVFSVFCMWSFSFSTNFDEFIFFMIVIKFSLCSLSQKPLKPGQICLKIAT